MASEKVIFEHQVFAQCCHYGGDLDWGPDGNLWLTTGDNMQWTLSTDDPFREENENTDVRRTAGNTQDTRGKILRIKPIPFPDSQTPPPGIGSTYTIPAGNMREHFAKQGFWSAAETSLVRPEIFSMGHRNPFTMALHPLRHYPAIGEAGWDNATNGEDEINLVTKPQNNGWPFFNGGNYTGTQNASLNPKQNASAPLNLSKWNTGVQKLPPAIPAALSNRTATVKANLACLGTVLAWAHTPTGPEAKVKFPAYLEGKLLFSSYGGVPLQAATVDDSGRITRVEQVLPARSELTFIFRAEPGPDGAIYIARGQNEYGTAPTPEARIVKLSYVGSCAPVATRPFGRTFKSPTNRGLWLFQPGQIASLPWPEGATSVRAYDMHGAMLWESKRFGANTLSGASAHALGKHRPGLVRLRFFGEAFQSASALLSATQD